MVVVRKMRRKKNKQMEKEVEVSAELHPVEEGTPVDEMALNADIQSPEPCDQSELDDARLESRENFDKYLRAVAELENFKRRSAKERADLLRYAGEGLARDILDVVDDLERALSQPAAGEEFSKGIKLIYDRFLNILDRHSIKPDSGLGTMFDPKKQEAIASLPTLDKPPGTVLEEFRKAYFFRDKVLRHGQVVVATEPSQASQTEGGAPPKSELQ